jgi:hypothetical protein
MTVKSITYTHLVIDARARVLATTTNLAAADDASRVAVREGQSAHPTIVDLAAADVAALARIAAVDYPALLRKGSGLLGAGTHPAQPYLEVMLHMTGITTEVIPGHTFGHDRVADIINAFLGNARAWQGETARAVKAALKAMAVKR